MALGYTLMNVAMLFIGPEEMAAKAGSLGAKGAEALAASRLWKRLGSIAESIPELKALAGAKRAVAEAKAGGTAVKGAEGLVEGGGKAAARVAEERLPASVAKDVITKEEALVEVEFINKHPERVKGSPPRAELGGEGPTKHEIVQLPDGTCERHSKKMPVPCPAVFKPKGTTSGEVKTTSSDLPHGDIVFGPAGGVPEGQFEYLRDQSGRPLAVEGWWNAEGATRNKAAQSAVSGPYNALSSRSTNAAHLAGRQGGGRGDAVNLVPVLRETNVRA
jgi:DNA/RNA non-specific endonuclease